jgi:hypothetical protein
LARRLFPEFFESKTATAAGSQSQKIRTKRGLTRTNCVRPRDLIQANTQFLVMAGLVPAIHVFLAATWEDVDTRDKPGHDEL